MASKAKIKNKKPLRHIITRPGVTKLGKLSPPKKIKPVIANQWETGILTVVEDNKSNLYLRINSGTAKDARYLKLEPEQAGKLLAYLNVYITAEDISSERIL